MELKLPYAGTCELTSHYGWRNLNGEDDYHSGIDLCGRGDKRILSPCAGVIGASTIVTDHANRTWEWGNYVRIDCGDGMQVYLCHMASRAISAGQRVEVGDLIGMEGNTGYSFGQHCHMEVRVNGAAVDPTPYLGIPNEWGYYENVKLEKPQEETEMAKSNTAWSDDAVAWATENGICYGDGSGDLKLDEKCTRRMVLTFLYRTAMWILKKLGAA